MHSIKETCKADMLLTASAAFFPHSPMLPTRSAPPGASHKPTGAGTSTPYLCISDAAHGRRKALRHLSNHLLHVCGIFHTCSHLPRHDQKIRHIHTHSAYYTAASNAPSPPPSAGVSPSQHSASWPPLPPLPARSVCHAKASCYTPSYCRYRANNT